MARPDGTRLRYWTPQIPSLTAWSVRRVRVALARHDDGDFEASGVLAPHLDRNPRTFAALNTRVLGVLGLPFSMDAADRNKRRADATARELETKWFEIAPEPVLGEMMRWLVLMGVAIGEVVWTTGDDGLWWPTIVPVHGALVIWREDLGRYQVQTETGLVDVVPGSGRWVLLSWARDRGHMLGVIRCLGLENTLRVEATRDWARWSEKHGLPITKMKVPAQSTPEDDEKVIASARSMGGEGVITLPQGATKDTPGYDAEFMELKDTSWEGFKELLSQCDTDASIAILGQNLTSEVKGGSFAAAKVHERVRQDYLEADTEALATALRRDVIIPWCAYNKGNTAIAPWPCWDATPPTDRQAVATTWSQGATALASLKTAGVKVDERAFCEELGIPLLAEEEPTNA